MMCRLFRLFRLFRLCSLLVLCLLVNACKPYVSLPKFHEISGEMMGTYFRVLFSSDTITSNEVYRMVKKVEKEMNYLFSQWQENSIISEVNSAPLHEWVVVPETFFWLVSESLRVQKQTNGYFDITLGKVTEEWRLAKKNKIAEDSLSESLSVLNASVFQNKLQLDQSQDFRIMKLTELSLDMSAIAKGYSVDVLKDELLAKGVMNFMVDIGGEIYLKGHNESDESWKIGVFSPEIAYNSTSPVVTLSENAIATSGDYFNYMKISGDHYSHIIDPTQQSFISRSSNRLISVTVIHKSTYLADAYATALLAMPIKIAKDWVNQNQVASIFLLPSEALVTQKSMDKVTNNYWQSPDFYHYLVDY